jgi:hypothetical protein
MKAPRVTPLEGVSAFICVHLRFFGFNTKIFFTHIETKVLFSFILYGRYKSEGV